MSPSRVLLVDDDPKVLRLLEATLRLKEHDVVKVESGTDALRWLDRESPDLIISGIMMPDLDGYEFLRRVREGSRHPTIPFIFLSARSEPEDVVRGLRCGADEFLRKPFSIDELLVRVDRVLARRPDAASDGARGAFEGDLGHMSVPDVLRMLCVQRKSGVLAVQLPDGAGAARLVVREGQVVHASLGIMEGEGVLFQLLLRDRGRFSFGAGESLPGSSVSTQTLPLLMEGYRLLDSGVLRRIDPNNAVAVEALGRVVASARAASPPLPALDAAPPAPAGVQPLRMPRGRPPLGSAAPLDHDELDETLALGDDILLEDEELPSVAELGPERGLADPVVAQLGGGVEVDGDWDRSGLLSYDGGLPAAVDDDGAREELDLDAIDPLDSVRLAAVLDPEDLAALEAELEGNPPPGRVMIGPEPEAAPEVQSTAVSLVDDTAISMPQMPTFDALERSAAMMDLFKHLKAETSSKLKARQTQLQTRAGQIIASDIQDEARRSSLAAFASQAIGFAARDEASGMQFAVLDAGDLHVLVLEVDEDRLYGILFDHRPEPASVIGALKPVLDRWRVGWGARPLRGLS